MAVSMHQRLTIPHWASEAPVNKPAFLQKKEENVREEELFFFKFFQQKQKLEKTPEGEQKKQSEVLEELGVDDNGNALNICYPHYGVFLYNFVNFISSFCRRGRIWL